MPKSAIKNQKDKVIYVYDSNNIHLKDVIGKSIEGRIKGHNFGVWIHPDKISEKNIQLAIEKVSNSFSLCEFLGVEEGYKRIQENDTNDVAPPKTNNYKVIYLKHANIIEVS